MTGPLEAAGRLVSVVLLVLGVVAMYAAALMLWRPVRTSARAWAPFAVMAAGAVLIAAGLALR